MKKLLTLTVIILSLMVLLPGCASDPNLINSAADIDRSTTIGALAGSPSLHLAAEFGTVISYISSMDMVNDLRAGILDCIIMESTTADELISGVSGVRILSEPLAEHELRIGVARENSALLYAIDEALDALHRNGTLRGIAERYFARRDFTVVPYYEGEVREFHGYLNVALPSDSPPFSFRNADGMLVGMDVDVARAVGDFLGVDLRVIETDVTELVEAVWLGIADITLGWHTVEGEGIINMSQPYSQAEHVIIVRRR